MESASTASEPSRMLRPCQRWQRLKGLLPLVFTVMKRAKRLRRGSHPLHFTLPWFDNLALAFRLEAQPSLCSLHCGPLVRWRGLTRGANVQTIYVLPRETRDARQPNA